MANERPSINRAYTNTTFAHDLLWIELLVLHEHNIAIRHLHRAIPSWAHAKLLDVLARLEALLLDPTGVVRAGAAVVTGLPTEGARHARKRMNRRTKHLNVLKGYTAACLSRTCTQAHGRAPKRVTTEGRSEFSNGKWVQRAL